MLITNPDDTKSPINQVKVTESKMTQAPPPKNVERDIYEYVDRKNKDTFFTTNLL
jgi:hypothetical protein